MKLPIYTVWLVLVMSLVSFGPVWSASLHNAVKANDLDLVSELISQGKPINSMDDWERTPLYS